WFRATPETVQREFSWAGRSAERRTRALQSGAAARTGLARAIHARPKASGDPSLPTNRGLPPTGGSRAPWRLARSGRSARQYPAAAGRPRRPLQRLVLFA